MKCIIKVDESGNTENHPILISNFLDVYPDLDISGNTAPPGFDWFTRKNRSIEFMRNKPQTHKVATQYIKTDKGFEDKFLQSHLHMVPGSGSKMQVPIVPFPTKNITPGVTRYKGLMGNQGRDNDKVRKAL